MFELHPHQQQVITDLGDAYRTGHRRIMLALATGGGKTVVAAHLAHRARAKGKKVLFIVDRIELVGQAVRHFADMGLAVGILQGENTSYSQADEVIVASIQTIRSRTAPEWVDVVFIDEAHILHQAHINLLGRWDALPFIGLSATPLRRDLGKYFTHLVRGPTVRWLTQNGFLVPSRAYCPGAETITRILDGVKVRAGDFVEKELAQAMNEKALVGDIIKTWKEKGEGRRTLAFACDIAHSKSIIEDFLAEGIAAEHLDAYTPAAARREIIARFRAGETTILSSVNVLGIGFDVPDAACLILARPTLSAALDMQQKGRGIRTAPGKSDCVMLDHAGNTLRHGLPVHFEVPDLDERDHKPKGKDRNAADGVVACRSCGYVMDRIETACPECGLDRSRPGPKVYLIDGELVPYSSYEDSTPENGPEYRLRWYLSLKWVARVRDYKPGYAAVQFREKFKEWPPREWQSLPPEEPAPDVSRWVRSQDIRFRKGRAKAESARAEG